MGMSLCKMSHFLGNITASLVTRAGSHRHTRVRGLSNCGLSCSINALLQTFSATTELQELLSRWQPSENADKRNVLLELKRALEAMKDKRQATPHLDLLDCLHEYNICRFTEHDADEVFHTILNLIQKQMSDQQIAADIKNLYKIDVEECTECSECGNVQRAPNIFLSFPLHLHDERNTLMDCFRMFFEPQMLEGSEAFYCGKCERKMPSTQAERRYRLYAVVVHAGMAMMGHYTAYIYSTDSMWYYINDSHMQQVSWEEVQRTYGGCRSKTAYMLLYRTLSSGAVQEPNP
ncbi:ubl carboxyl-terminal hydrolase 18 isoform X2 [Tachysurus fulvidraco]|uniref:ubl carboxyl-terminal hydrolase 18 isoform X2 n=1 Tax=Tachysurus fulvidraco TaxID=1234273 RepID=UPI001FEEBDEC|nr:ubl carboxyl-terminal hydrolase 18 isoform X2 [Tachysurus fulvidraco]